MTENKEYIKSTEKNKYIKNNEDVEIDLKDLFYSIFKKWRGIILFAVCVAVIAGAAFSAKAYMDKDVAELEAYNVKLESAKKQYELTDDLLNFTMNRLDTAAVMKIAPTEAVYIEYDYDLELKKDLLDLADIDRVNERYAKLIERYVLSLEGTVLDSAAVELGYDIDDLRDLVDIKGDLTTHNISIGVYSSSSEEALKIIDIFDSAIPEITAKMLETAGEHTITRINEIMKENASQYIVNTQLKYINSLTEIRNSLDSFKTTVEDMENAAPDPVDTASILKKFVKYFLIGGIAAGIMAGGCIFLMYLMNGKLKSREQFGDLFNLRCFGVVKNTAENKKKCPLACIDRFIDRIFCIKKEFSGEESYAFSASGIANAFATLGLGKDALVVFAGSLADEEISELSAYVTSKLGLTNVSCFGKLNQSFEAVERIPKADAVILVEAIGESLNKEIEEELVILDDNNAKLLGVILVDKA
ncbi:MAG: hypothetical protein Q4B86_08320 [Eubacteriales bacterium]|nr:hypothetical protein [Eubacteriales bacterium]